MSDIYAQLASLQAREEQLELNLEMEHQRVEKLKLNMDIERQERQQLGFRYNSLATLVRDTVQAVQLLQQIGQEQAAPSEASPLAQENHRLYIKLADLQDEKFRLTQEHLKLQEKHRALELKFKTQCDGGTDRVAWRDEHMRTEHPDGDAAGCYCEVM